MTLPFSFISLAIIAFIGGSLGLSISVSSMDAWMARQGNGSGSEIFVVLQICIQDWSPWVQESTKIVEQAYE